MMSPDRSPLTHGLLFGSFFSMAAMFLAMMLAALLGNPKPRSPGEKVMSTPFAFPAVILIATLLVSPVATGQSDEVLANDLLHSDLPLFGRGGENEWPRRFRTEDDMGCASRLALGDWSFRQQGISGVLWYRFSLHEGFGCWANTSRSSSRDKLRAADTQQSFFIRLGNISVDGTELELWTIQIGARPGSQYLLLSRPPTKGLVDSFTVLQAECPRASVRDGGLLDILLTRYCAVSSRGELIRLARRMAKLPPLGTLTRVSDESDAQE